jgi:RNA polymerase sigma-70 factor, ECF subfamily
MATRPGEAAEPLRQSANAGERTDRAVTLAVRRAQAGDRDALAYLYARYADNVCGYIRSVVRDHHEAEDLTQTVFVKLTRVIGKYQEREVPFFAWLLRVARNVALDHLRSNRSTPVEEVRGSDASVCDPSSSSPLRDLQEALDRLPQAQREVLVLRHIAGLSPMEIAQLTGRSEGSVHGLHHRGRRTLIDELTAMGASPSRSPVKQGPSTL